MGLFSKISKSARAQSTASQGDWREHISPLEAKLQLITGKGGVGRTTVSIALATAYAAQGIKTLVLEVRDAESELNDDAEGGGRDDSMLARALSQDGFSHLRELGKAPCKDDASISLGANPRLFSDSLWAAQLVAPVGHAAFLRSIIPSDRLVRAALDSVALSKFLRSAPSMHELGLFYHLKSLADDPRFERIVIDMPATGHALALAQLPERIARIIKKGQIVEGLRAGVRHISDPRQSSLWVVSLPETLPLTEANEMSLALKKDGLKVAGIICNRNASYELTSDERFILDQLTRLDSDRLTWCVERINGATISSQDECLLESFDLHLCLPELAHAQSRAQYIAEEWFSYKNRGSK